MQRMSLRCVVRKEISLVTALRKMIHGWDFIVEIERPQLKSYLAPTLANLSTLFRYPDDIRKVA